jgi:MoxR-like ATPase
LHAASLNERIFRRGKETRPLRALMFVGASNHLPEDDALHALFDRFLLRVHCDNVGDERLSEVLVAGWNLIQKAPARSSLHFDDLSLVHAALPAVQLQEIRRPFSELVHRIRHAGIPVSDRRAVKLQRVIAASALLCGRDAARLSDLWPARHIWDTEEQQEVLAELVDQAVSKEPAAGGDHQRARLQDGPDPEGLARDLESIAAQMQNGTEVDKSILRDRLGILEGRCQWVKEPQKRDWLLQRIAEAWPRLRV